MLKKIASLIWKTTPRAMRLRVVRATQNKFTASVGAIITNKNGEILLLDHVLRPGSGWGIPGGFIEYGEQPEEAARRELREETGLELENVKLLRARTINRHIEFIFRARAQGEAKVLSREIRAAQWFEIDKMPEKMSEVQKSLVEKVLSQEV